MLEASDKMWQCLLVKKKKTTKNQQNPLQNQQRKKTQNPENSPRSNKIPFLPK